MDTQKIISSKVGDWVTYCGNLQGRVGCVHEDRKIFYTDICRNTSGSTFKFPDGGNCKEHKTFMGYGIDSDWKLGIAPMDSAVHDWQKMDVQISESLKVGAEINYSGKIKKTMSKISNAFKKFIDADLQKQVKAGFRDGELELTQIGKDVLLEILVDSAKEKFTAEADAKIKEEEKNK